MTTTVKFVPLNKAFALSHMHETVFAFTFEFIKGKWIKTTERPLSLTICGFTNNGNYDIYYNMDNSNSSNSSSISTTVAQKYIVLQKPAPVAPFILSNTGILDRRAYRLYVVENTPRLFLVSASSSSSS